MTQLNTNTSESNIERRFLLGDWFVRYGVLTIDVTTVIVNVDTGEEVCSRFWKNCRVPYNKGEDRAVVVGKYLGISTLYDQMLL